MRAATRVTDLASEKRRGRGGEEREPFFWAMPSQTRHRRGRRVAGNVVALGALLAGCGGGDGSGSHAQESTPQSAPPRSTPAPAPQPRARWSYTQLVRHLAGRP